MVALRLRVYSVRPCTHRPPSECKQPTLDDPLRRSGGSSQCLCMRTIAAERQREAIACIMTMIYIAIIMDDVDIVYELNDTQAKMTFHVQKIRIMMTTAMVVSSGGCTSLHTHTHTARAIFTDMNINKYVAKMFSNTI